MNTYIFIAFLYYKSLYIVLIAFFLLGIQASTVKKTLDSGGFSAMKSSSFEELTVLQSIWT